MRSAIYVATYTRPAPAGPVHRVPAVLPLLAGEYLARS